MSFFAKLGSGSDTDSESGSESEESILSGEEGEEQDRKLAAKNNRASMFLRSDDEESESEEEEEEMSEEESGDERAVRRFGSRWRSERADGTGNGEQVLEGRGVVRRGVGCGGQDCGPERQGQAVRRRRL
jgi:hypothetical protein